METQSI